MVKTRDSNKMPAAKSQQKTDHPKTTSTFVVLLYADVELNHPKQDMSCASHGSGDKIVNLKFWFI